jgi:Cdc6-like AAA superfamily ATPase
MPLLVVFEEFTQDQLTNILTNRIHGDIVHPNAINLIGMKLMRNVHGDGRIAVQLLLQSLEHSINIETQKNSSFWEGKDAYYFIKIYSTSRNSLTSYNCCRCPVK